MVAIKPDYDAGKVKRVALLNFDDYPGFSGSGAVAGSAFEPYLIKADYDVVERRQVDKLLQQQAFSLTGAVDPRQAQALGKLLGVDALVLGSLTSFVPGTSQVVLTDISSQSSSPIYDTVVRTHRDGETTVRNRVSGYNTVATHQQVPETYTTPSRVGMAVRMVDAATGDVLWIGSCTESGDSVQAAANLSASQIFKALRKALPRPLKGQI